MGAQVATFGLLLDAIDQVGQFIDVFTLIYSLVILLYIIASLIRLPYSTWGSRIQRFLYDVVEPYLRLFRRFLPSFGPLDLSPMVAVFVLWLLNRVAHTILDSIG